MNYVLHQVDRPETKINKSKKMSTTQFMAWYNFEPQAALELLTEMIQHYIEYDVQKFQQKHGPQTEVTKRLRD